MINNKYTYAAMVPLIGGGPLGTAEALDGQLPEYVLSYSPFAGNDEHYINYLREKKGWTGDYVHLDTQTDYVPKNVDVVISTCPCAGLSSLSRSSNADNPVNEWMYTTSEYVLSTVKPKVFWGENAPRLFSSMGKKVADNLFEIGKKYGYSFNMYFTDSRLHGLAQGRARTFYFFTKSETTPKFNWFKLEPEPIEVILQTPKADGDPMNMQTTVWNPLTNGWVAYALHVTNSKTINELYHKIDKTQNLIVFADNKCGHTLLEAADWMEANGFESFGTRARSMQVKRDDGKGYWAHGVTIVKNTISALIGAQPYYSIDPFTGQYYTIRDCLRIMKMPDDFNLVGDSPRAKVNMICQNIPVSTARDMMLNVVEFLDGKCTMSDSNYLKQNNKTQITNSVTNGEENTSQELSEFF